MSAYVNAIGNTISASIVPPVADTAHRLITAWVMRPAGVAQGSANVAMRFQHDTEARRMTVQTDANGLALHSASHGAGGASVYKTGLTVPPDVWTLIGGYAAPNNGSTSAAGGVGVGGELYVQSGRITAFSPSGGVMNTLFLGADAASGSQSRWRGYIAEASIWIAGDEAQARAIWAELATRKPNQVEAGTPHWYAPLLSSGAAVIGGATTVNGMTAFNADVHPPFGDTPVPVVRKLVVTDIVPGAIGQTVRGTVFASPSIGAATGPEVGKFAGKTIVAHGSAGGFDIEAAELGIESMPVGAQLRVLWESDTWGCAGTHLATIIEE